MPENITCQRFTGKTVLITGAASGIGAATAMRVNQEGGHPILFDLQAEKLNSVARQCNGTAVVGNALNLDDLQKAVTIADTQHGGLDAFVAAAGFETYGGAEEVDINQWHNVIAINLDGALIGARAVLPSLKSKGAGAIVLVSSIGGLAGSIQNAAYGTAKAGLLGLNRSIAADNGPFNIRCNAVCPGLAYSELTERMFKTLSEGLDISVDEIEKKITKPLPLGRIAQPQEIASAIAFLASADASYMTGSSIIVDGGAMATEVALSHLAP